MVLFQDAGVFDDEQAGSRAGCSFFVGDAFLHPDGFGADANGGVDDFRHGFGAAENVHDVGLFGNVFQARVDFFAEDFFFVRDLPG